MKSFNNHSGLRGLPRFAKGIYWATGSSLMTPFTEGCPGVNDKASPPGRHQGQAPKQRCTFRPTTFSSVQFSAKGSLTASTDCCPIDVQKLWTQEITGVGEHGFARARFETLPGASLTADLLDYVEFRPWLDSNIVTLVSRFLPCDCVKCQQFNRISARFTCIGRPKHLPSGRLDKKRGWCYSGAAGPSLYVIASEIGRWLLFSVVLLRTLCRRCCTPQPTKFHSAGVGRIGRCGNSG